MVLYLREYETFPVQMCLHAGPDEIVIKYDGVNKVKGVTVDLNIQHSGEEYFCQGVVKAILELECVRCLKPFDKELAGKMGFIICSEEFYQQQQAKAIDDEDYVFLQGNALKADLTDIIRQTVVLTIPMMPLCSQTCQGLCPHCGADLNEHRCDCHDERIDERWAGLKNLRDKL